MHNFEAREVPFISLPSAGWNMDWTLGNEARISAPKGGGQMLLVAKLQDRSCYLYEFSVPCVGS